MILKKCIAISAVLFMLISSIPVNANISGTSSLRTSDSQVNATSDISKYIVPGVIIVKYKNKPFDMHEFKTESISFDTSQYEKISLPPGTDVFSEISKLSKDPDVEYAQPVYLYSASDTPPSSAFPVGSGGSGGVGPVPVNDPYYASQWGLSVTDMTYAWQTIDEKSRENVKIAVIDSGVDHTHYDLEGSIIKGKKIGDIYSSETLESIVESSPDDLTLTDDTLGHGTHVAGIACAVSNNAKGIAGVASGAKIMPIKVFKDDTDKDKTSSDKVTAGIYWAVKNGADVINLSLGVPSIIKVDGKEIDTFDQFEYDAIKYALCRGVVVVAAAGNNGVGKPIDYPAAYPGVIAVGSVKKDIDNEIRLSSFSSTGISGVSGADFVAPGEGIESTVPNLDHDRNCDGITIKNGTSMAAPFVSGIAALIKAGNKNLSSSDVYYAIYNSSYLPPDNRFDDARLVNAGKAFSLSKLMIKTAGPGEVEPDTSGLEQYIAPDKTDIPARVSFEDYRGTVQSSVYSSAQINTNIYTSSGLQNYKTSEIELKSGEGSGNLQLNDPGLYSVNSSITFEGEQYNSKKLYFVKKPFMPDSDIKPDSYSVSQNISLTSKNKGAKIYYTTDGSNPIQNGTMYINPIPVSSTMEIKAVSVENLVASDVASFKYTITFSNTSVPSTTVITGGGGGGGGGAPIAIAPTPVAATPVPSDTPVKSDVAIASVVNSGNGTLTTKIELDDQSLTKLVDSSGEKGIVLDAAAGRNEKSVRTEIASNILNMAEQKNKPVIIEAGRIKFEIKPGILTLNGASSIHLSSGIVSSSGISTPQASRMVSEIYDFGLSVGDKRVEEFKKPVIVSIAIDESKIKNKNKLGVYYYNESTSSWQYSGGIAMNGEIWFEAGHFSKYAVMEYDKTFSDILGHWAKDDIEIMASKHIAEGSNDAFRPDGKITRAEFAALLVRAVNAKDTSGKSFNDIQKGAWYEDVVKKAYAAGIVSGIDNNTFDPDRQITREELCTMLLRAYQYKIGKSEGINGSHADFKDEKNISSWAKDSVRKTSLLGLMNGRPDGTFAPSDNATRAEAVVAIKHIIDKIQY